MAITLDFYGGLFVVDESETTRLVEVHFWRPRPVKVLVDGLPDHGLARLLTLASQADFDGSPLGEVDDVPVRPLSEAIPVDYRGSVKMVRFAAGKMSGDGPPVTDRARELFQQARNTSNGDDDLVAFRQLSGITGKNDARLRTLADEFFAQDVEELKFWQLGYHITVQFSELSTLLNGLSGSSYPIPDKAHILFDTEETSTIPHLPMNNPHVLERPPTRRKKKR